jgi:hypothetical protein
MVENIQDPTTPDAKSIVRNMRYNATDICHKENETQAAGTMLLEVGFAKRDPATLKAVAAEIKREGAGVVHSEHGTPTSFDIKAGKGCKRVNVDLKAETVNGMNGDAWEALGQEKFDAGRMKDLAAGLSNGGRAGWAKEMLSEVASIRANNTSMDGIAKQLLQDKSASIARGPDNSITSITFNPKDNKSAPVTVNLADSTVNGMNQDQWAAK